MAGIASIHIICTPTESPMAKKIRMIHLSLSAALDSFSHLVISHTSSAINSEAIAYTSPSTAENQNVSEKVKHKAPMTPANRIEIS
ncbi:hypothetical protein D9M71_667950 [compost metagenome]